MKISVSNLQVVNLMKELYGLVKNEPGEQPVIIQRGILSYELSGVARKRLNRIGSILKKENEIIESTKRDLLKKYGRKVGNDLYPIQIDEKSSEEDKEKFNTYRSEIIKMLEDKIEIDIDMLDDSHLPTTNENFELVFTLLTQN